MATPAEILELLSSRKVFEGGKWRVYRDDGTELADPGGVLWRGLHGFLLFTAAAGSHVLDILTHFRRRGRR